MASRRSRDRRRRQHDRSVEPDAQDVPGDAFGAVAAYLRPRAVPFLLVVIVIVGSTLRFYRLGAPSLWNDELWTWQIANKSSLTEVLTTGRLPDDVHPPLHFMFHYYLQKYVGDSETVLRFPSAVAGVLTIVAIFLLGRRLYGDREGLIAAAMTAVLWCPIRYSQEARAYAMLVLFVTLATYFWIDVVRRLSEGSRPPLRASIAFAACALAASMLHYFGLYFIGLQGVAAVVVLLVRRPRAVLWLPLLYVAIGIAYVPWLPTMLRSLGLPSFWVQKPPPDKLLGVLCFLFNYSKPLMAGVLAAYAWLAARTLYERYRKVSPGGAKPATPYAGLMLALWMVVPYAGVHLKSLLSTPVLTNRNMLIMLPAAYLLTARALARVSRRVSVTALVAALVCVLFLVDLFHRIDYYNVPSRDQVRETVAYVLEFDRRYPDSIIIGHTYGEDFFNYYFEKLGSTRRVDVRGGLAKETEPVDEFIRSRGPRHIWFLFANRRPEPAFVDHLHRRFHLIGGRYFLRTGVALFRNEPPPPGSPRIRPRPPEPPARDE